MMWPLLITVLIAVAVGLGLSQLFGLFRVRGESMLPTLQEGDWVLARRCLPWEKLRPGEVVIVRRDALPPIIIKRLAATSADSVPAELRGALDKVPSKCYLLYGDNPDLPLSQRYTGPVSCTQVWGKAWLVAWPRRSSRWLRRGRAVPEERTGRGTPAEGAGDS